MSDQLETHFDFWLGEWDCIWSDIGKGMNRILRIMDGKVIHENFSSRNFWISLPLGGMTPPRL